MASNLIKYPDTNNADTANYDKKYQELAADYKNMVSRYEKRLLSIGREKESEIYAKGLPIYEEIVRAFVNAWTRDLEFLKGMLENYFTNAGYIIMDSNYFKSYNINPNRPPIETVAEAIHTTYIMDGAGAGTVDVVYGMGLFDTRENKVVVFPRVSVRCLYEQR